MNVRNFSVAKEETDTSESCLWQKFKAGNELAFFEIYDTYINLLYNYGTKFTQDDKLVEDCIHDLFVNLWENKANIGDIKHLKYYLYISLRRKIISSEQRKLKYTVDNSHDTKFTLLVTASIEEKIIAEQAAIEQISNLNRVISELSERQQEVIFLKFYGNFSAEEIADIMSININSVYKLTNKALKNIRKLIKKEDVWSLFILIPIGILLLSLACY